jgi:hypothetical protein
MFFCRKNRPSFQNKTEFKDFFKVNYAYAAVTISWSETLFNVSAQFSLGKHRLTPDFGKKHLALPNFRKTSCRPAPSVSQFPIIG